jgi:hypothetical protein
MVALFFLFVHAGSIQSQNIESQIWLYSVRWGENKWPVRPLGGWTTVQRLAVTVWRFGTWWFFSWRGSWTACWSAWGGDGVDGHHYWWPCVLSRISGFGEFFSNEKNFGEQKFARLSALNFCGRILVPLLTKRKWFLQVRKKITLVKKFYWSEQDWKSEKPVCLTREVLPKGKAVILMTSSLR